MLLLTRSAAILDDHTRPARLEIDAAGPLLLAALGTAAICGHRNVHVVLEGVLVVVSCLHKYLLTSPAAS